MYDRTNRCYNERGSRANYVRSSIPRCIYLLALYFLFVLCGLLQLTKILFLSAQKFQFLTKYVSYSCKFLFVLHGLLLFTWTLCTKL